MGFKLDMQVFTQIKHQRNPNHWSSGTGFWGKKRGEKREKMLKNEDKKIALNVKYINT